jgi:predicted nucleotidyltransferase
MTTRPTGLSVPESIAEPFRAALICAGEAWTADLGERLVSLVLFGSVARGQARPDSDVDLLVVAAGFPHSLAERRKPLLDTWDRARVRDGLPPIPWNLVTKSPEEARYHSPLYLDMVEDGVPIFDRDGFFAAILAAMQARMRELGSRRVFLPDGGWYWDLKPDFRAGDVVEI